MDLAATATLATLKVRLRSAFPGVDDEVRHDAITDAFMDYLAALHRITRLRATPSQFLYRAAWRNVADAAERAWRRRRREAAYVRECCSVRSCFQESDAPNLGVRLAGALKVVHFDHSEVEALTLWLNGEGRVHFLAEALGLSTLTPEAQRREVKRFKDRIIKRLKRVGTRRRANG